MKNIKIIFVLLMLILLSACGIQPISYEGSTQKSERFFGDANYLRIIKDNQTGCEYIAQNSGTSWTYVHGSCPDIIAEEYSLKNLEK